MIEPLPVCATSGTISEKELRARLVSCVVQRDIQLDGWREWWNRVKK